MSSTSYISSKIKIGDDGKGGRGLFAAEKINKGELIVDFTDGPGKYLNTDEADELYDEGNDYMLQVDDNKFFVATSESELEDADFLNHSCDPTCGINGKLKIVAIRDILPGEEVTFDYAMSESADYSMECKCGSKSCRKVVTGNDWKIPELQKKYNGFFSDYLQRKIDGLNKK